MAEPQKNMQRKDDDEEEALRASYPEFELLINKRVDEILPREISARANLDEQVQSSPGDDADISILDTSADYFLRLANNHQLELIQLRDAMNRMRRGVYGFCESCERPIALERLRKLPAARFCIDCQATMERAALMMIPGGRRPTL